MVPKPQPTLLASLLLTLGFPALACSAPPGATAETPTADRWTDERERMVAEVAGDFAETGAWTGYPEASPEVLAALGSVPRHEFVPDRLDARAYDNRPLPIGSGQTISQPFIVALMTEVAELARDDRVLEVGTGSGYQAAVLAEIVDEVLTIEIVPELAETARERLERLGYDHVEVRQGDGWAGWPERAPFDAILVTAAPDEVPPPLVEQLAPGGRLVLPVGPVGGRQELLLVTKGADGETTRRTLLPVAFVPLTGDHGQR